MKVHTVSQEAFSALNDAKLVVRNSDDVPVVLDYLVGKIAELAKADVCSLYLYHPESKILTLKATHGLNKSLVDEVHLHEGEGLSGMAVKLMQPVSVSDVKRSHDFKLIPGLHDENIRSLLAVPLVYNRQPIGVLVVRHFKVTRYKKQDISLLMSLAIPAVNIIERARFLGALGTASTTYNSDSGVTVAYLKDHHIKGIAAAAGIAMGRLKKIDLRKTRRRRSDAQSGPDSETVRLKAAFAAVTTEIQNTKKQAEKKFGPDEVSIFEAYLLLLQSQSFQNQIIAQIETGQVAVQALQNVVQKYLDRFASASDEYIKERAYDIQDIARKIADHLLYDDANNSDQFLVSEQSIFLHDEWSVSDFVHLPQDFARGIISPQGGASSHIAVLSDSLGLPAVLGLGSATLQMRDGDYLIVDGYSGTVIINPSPETLNTYQQELTALKKLNQTYLKTKDKPVKILRGKTWEQIPIGANIEMSVHVDNALKGGADEIGLFRTEFPFLVRKTLPTEDEQYQLYRHVLKTMKQKPVTFRTLDIGCDKAVSYLDIPKETNPALGWRSIRFSLERKDLFRIQMRALLKASVYGRMRLLFPMVSSMEQVFEIEEIIASIKKEISDENHSYAKNIPVGYMIEVPAAVGIAEKMAKRADFLSIGTNDLIQYCLAVDRTNPKVANLYDPYHPSVLGMINDTLTAAKKVGTHVSVCGDMAAKPLLAPFLCSLGVHSLSMNPSSIPKIKALLPRLNFSEVKKLTAQILKMDTGAEIKSALVSYFQKNDLMEFLTSK